MTTIIAAILDDIVLTEAECKELLEKREREKQKQEIKELWNALNSKMAEYGWHWYAHLPKNGYWSYGSHRINTVDFYDKALTLNVARN